MHTPHETFAALRKEIVRIRMWCAGADSEWLKQHFVELSRLVDAAEHESRSPDGDGQAMIGVSVTERDDTVRPPTPNSPRPADDERTSSGSSDSRSGNHSALMAAGQTEAGSEPADSLTPHADAILRAALFRLTTFDHTYSDEWDANYNPPVPVHDQFCVPCIAQRALDAEATARKEPVMMTTYRCRCGFTVDATIISRLRVRWIHRNADGVMTTNDGCAYCPICDDETLVEQEPADARTPSEPPNAPETDWHKAFEKIGVLAMVGNNTGASALKALREISHIVDSALSDAAQPSQPPTAPSEPRQENRK